MVRSRTVSYIRGLSIAAIVLYHLIAYYLQVPEIMKMLSRFGGAGVHLFFIISGFGLALSYNRKWCGLKTYISRRFYKVYLPYIVVVLLCFFTPWILTTENRVSALLSHVFLYKMFSDQYTISFGAHFWYVSTLIQFYVLFPVLMKIKRKYGNKVFITGTFVISVVWTIIIILLNKQDSRVWNSCCIKMLWEFSLGIVCADYYERKGKIYGENLKTLSLWCVTMVGAVTYVLFSIRGGISQQFNDVFAVISFGGVTLLFAKYHIMEKTVQYISSISYEIYLLHLWILTTVFHFLQGNIAQFWIILIALAMIVIISGVYHKILEFFLKLVGE